MMSPPAFTPAQEIAIGADFSFVGGFAQGFDLAEDCCPIRGEVFFCHGAEAHDSPVGRDTEGVGHEGLQKRGVALVGCGLDLGGERGDG